MDNDKQLYKIIGNNVKRLRLERELSQDKLAELLGYKSRSSVNKIEIGERGLPIDTLIELSKIFDCSMEVLTTKSESSINYNFMDEDMVNSIVGMNVYRYRTDLNMTQDELAQILGYRTRSTIAKIEAGTNGVQASSLLRFAKVFNCSVNDLLPKE